MDAIQAIRTLRVVRDFREERLTDEQLDTILDAGRHAGSSKNTQRWAFMTVTDRDRLMRLSEVGPYASHLAGAAVAVALITPRPDSARGHSIMWDLGRAAQNMSLAAWALGIGSVPATVYDEPLARRILRYPEDRYCEYLLSLGLPADRTDLTRPPRAGGRLPLSEVVHRERW